VTALIDAGAHGAAVDVVFPQLSEDDPTAEGALATWFVSDGDQVASGNCLAR
jgi:pyruvate/2-oxoglutarate dehydrogenase complex dihydrolipoamide acyltransferase (E2) component